MTPKIHKPLHSGFYAAGFYTAGFYTTLAGLLFFPLAVAHSDSSTLKTSTIHWSQTVTQDSALKISGRMHESVRGVWIHISRPGLSRSESIYPAVVDGRFEQRVFLREGPGVYRISVRETTEPQKRFRTFFEITEFKVENADAANRRFLLPSLKVESDHPEIVQLARKITAGASSASARSRRIHDWIATNIAYDADRRLAGQKSEKTALETLRTRVAFCNGYAHLNAALHRAAGIPARLILGWGIQNGQRELHEWNEVLLGGRWRAQDVTWNAGGISAITRKFVFNFSARYFNPPMEIFLRDHQKIKVLHHE